MTQIKKAAIITGAGSGIGRAIAIEFAKHGYFVFLMGRNKENLEETALRCRAGASLLSCDINDESAVKKRIQEAFSNPLVQTEVLINNAGIYRNESSQNFQTETWIEQLQTNLIAPVRLTSLVIPHFIKAKKGSIVNISSTLGLKPAPMTGAYSASKAALNNWTLCLAQELGSHGIRANAVCPGIVDTPIHSFHHKDESTKKQIVDSMGKLQPLQRIGTPEEIAKAAYFLGSDDSSWTTGSLLSVDGGINIQ